MRFSYAVDEYLADKAKRLRGNTMEGYVSALRRHVLPVFGGREVEEITHDEVQEWVDSIPTYGAAERPVTPYVCAAFSFDTPEELWDTES